jgi:hypothetical protein
MRRIVLEKGRREKGTLCGKKQEGRLKKEASQGANDGCAMKEEIVYDDECHSC